jgi:sarcosine oxidase subunit alpha
VVFSFQGKPVRAFLGDTLGSALYASGQRIFSRSFKYHRPRGLLCCSGNCANCMMTVDGVPNVRICAEPVREGAVVRPQNVLGSLEHDALVVTDKLGGPFTPVGFYYRTMIRPRWAWPLYEKFLRNVAGLGKLDEHAGRANRYDVEHRRAEVLVVGGGQAGREAARAHAAAGRQVVLVDEGFVDPLAGVDVVSPGRALGIWEGGLVPVDAGSVLYRYRAEKIVVATGTIEQPLVFPGNDLVGVMLPDGVRRLIEDWGIKPAEKAVVVTVDEAGREAAAALQQAGVEIVGVYDLRRERVREIVARGRKGILRSVEIDGRKLSCDLLVMSGGRQPAYSLLAQAGARVEYDPERGIFIPTDIPDGIATVGSVGGEGLAGAVPAASYNGASGKGKCFVCVCEDVTDKDLKRAIGEGFDSIELAKRYTTVTMGPCQGRFCHVPSIRRGRRSRSASSRAGPTSRRSARRSTTATRSLARR